MDVVEQISDAFELGWHHVRPIDQDRAKAELMELFHVTSEPAWLRWLRGENKLSRNTALAIEAIFAKYRVEPEQIWGRYES